MCNKCDTKEFLSFKKLTDSTRFHTDHRFWMTSEDMDEFESWLTEREKALDLMENLYEE